nr:GGDEF domain-containing protein [Shimia abyssi]
MVCLGYLTKMLDVFCPMHMVLDATGHISHAGPTAQKLLPDDTLVNKRFLEVFELCRPRSVSSMEQLLGVAGLKLHLRKRDAAQTTTKGVLVPLPDNGGAIINLSFGISIIDAVRDFALTSADFAATDLTIEMLYLVEAKSAAMEASRKLNQRLQGAMIAAEEQAFTDTLTGLKNRRALETIVPRLLEDRSPFGMMQIDLDFFKAVNDTLGHAAGDHVLQRVAKVLVENSRDDDCVARVGGDEFVMVFKGITDADVLGRIAARIIAEVEHPMPFKEHVCKVSASVGISVFAGQVGTTIDTIMSDVDIALYASKHQGRATYTLFSENLRQDGPLSQ